MPASKPTSNRSYYSTLQLFVAFTFVFVVFLTAKFTSVTLFDTRPERVRGSSSHTVHKEELHLDIIATQRVNKKAAPKKFDYIIENQRLRIGSEMDQFPFDHGDQLKDFVMDQGGQPVRAMITTTWRSGSTFLGDILLSHPATYYHYEPLIHFYIHQVRDGTPLAAQATKVINSLFRCDYSDLGSFLDYAKVHLEAFSHNERLWSQCFGDNRKHCYDPEFLSQFCSLFPFQSMKTVRFRLNLTRTLIDDPSLNVQVLLLVRDPRGTLQSRKHRSWCPGKPDCDRPEALCSDLVSDYRAAQDLTKAYPNRVRVIRYEDFCKDIKSNAKTLLNFFGFKMHPRVSNFIDSHTHMDLGGVSSTFRDSKNAPYHWRHELNFSEVQEIQQKCSHAMKLWGYKLAASPEDLQTLDPLLDYFL